MFYRTITSVRISGGITSEFSITIGLHQGSTLSPCLIALVMSNLIKSIQEEVLEYMLFVDNIVLVDETRSELYAKLEIWRDILESKSF